MLKLGGKVIEIHAAGASRAAILSVSCNADLPEVLRPSKAYLARDGNIPPGFAHYLLLEAGAERVSHLPAGADYTLLPADYDYLGEDDVVRLSPDRKSIRVLFRASSPHNSILVTEQCNHYCLMCSQPPKKIDDSWILREIEELIPLIPRQTTEIGFTGGEPTLFGERFLDLLRLAKNYLPRTAIHILSNGRRFSDAAFARTYADIQHPDMMVGIPIYSDDPARHDYVVQAKGAFDEAVRGILNLKRFRQKVEVRIVIHKQSIGRLVKLAEFLARNLLFVDHVALMALEMTGFTRANIDKLWIDPYDYRAQLSEAANIMAGYGMSVSVYNHPLCLVNADLHRFYRKSISDWKNEYAPECEGCLKLSECGGFFASGIQHGYSRHISPFLADG